MRAMISIFNITWCVRMPTSFLFFKKNSLLGDFSKPFWVVLENMGRTKPHGEAPFGDSCSKPQLFSKGKARARKTCSSHSRKADEAQHLKKKTPFMSSEFKILPLLAMRRFRMSESHRKSKSQAMPKVRINDLFLQSTMHLTILLFRSSQATLADWPFSLDLEPSKPVPNAAYLWVLLKISFAPHLLCLALMGQAACCSKEPEDGRFSTPQGNWIPFGARFWGSHKTPPKKSRTGCPTL